ncbi:MAG TPA: cbb3-type cytochrome oxidase assembly protein CcoS [Gemmatimonadaceae bacterium]|jgi:cbb3-type cytochrome oxidase maturation protein
MSVLYLILPLALLVVFVAVAGFVWAARRGQFDDLDTPAMRALHDEVSETKQSSETDSGPRERRD